MKKAIFLDRDGTINEDYGYVYKISDLKYIDGVIESLRQMNELGYILIVISNQSGIGRGYYTSNDAEKLFDYMVKYLKTKGVDITKYYYCPHVDSDLCECRKPKLKLFYDAINEFNIDLSKSFAIGDKERDLSICQVTPVKGILISDKDNDTSYYVCKKNMRDALKYIKYVNSGGLNEKK